MGKLLKEPLVHFLVLAGLLFVAQALFARDSRDLIVVDASEAHGATTGNGHGYFRSSPWTSSDILATLTFDLKPAQRGLQQTGGQHIWTFAEDYIDRLRTAVIKAQSK